MKSLMPGSVGSNQRALKAIYYQNNKDINKFILDVAKMLDVYQKELTKKEKEKTLNGK